MMSQAAAARAIRTAPLTRSSSAEQAVQAASVAVSGIASASTFPLSKLATSTAVGTDRPAAGHRGVDRRAIRSYRRPQPRAKPEVTGTIRPWR